MERKSLVVNLYGGPSTGKSSCAAGVFSLLKFHGVNSELITEFAKDLVWEERFNTLKDQRYLFGKQYHRSWRVNGKVDVIVTDSPLFLNIIYGHINSNVPNTFNREVLSVMGEFDNMNIFLQRVKPYQPIGRTQTEDEAKNIDKIMINYLHDYDLDFIEVPGNVEGINIITKMVLNNIEKELKFKIDKI
jgi:hypothetical protein